MKRLCMFCLIVTLLLGLASGVQAAGCADRFTDWNEIENQPQVAMLADLRIINGYTDGSFQPINSVTRAEIAKVITFVKTAAMPASANRFTDTAGNWAADYIAYCADAEILSGDGAGTFRPNDYVTGRELAKMLLVTVGYPAGRYSGAGWAEAVDRDAEAAGIYDGYQADREQYISRDNACLLINNALQCSVIVGYGQDGAAQYALDEMMSPKSLLEYRFGVKLVTGVVMANGAADLRTAGAHLDGNYIHIDGYTRDFLVADGQTAHDTGLLGRKVTLYASFGGQYNIAYGLPSTRPSEIYAIFPTAAQYRAVVDYGVLQITEKTKFYKDFCPDDASCVDTMAQSDTVTIIDHENDGAIDIVLVSTAAQQALGSAGGAS